MREKTEGGQELEIILKDGVLDDLGSRIKYLIGVIHLERRYIAFLCIELCYVSAFFVSFTKVVVVAVTVAVAVVVVVDSMHELCDVYNLKSLDKAPTCYKNPDNPSCIDLILANKPCSFQNTTVFESGLSDFHKFTVTIMKSYYFAKQVPKVICYRNYKYFTNENFRNDVHSELIQHNTNCMDCQLFENFFLKTLDMHAPRKKTRCKSEWRSFYEFNPIKL